MREPNVSGESRGDVSGSAVLQGPAEKRTGKSVPSAASSDAEALTTAILGTGVLPEKAVRDRAVKNSVSSGGTGFQPVKKHGQDGRATSPRTQSSLQPLRHAAHIAVATVHGIQYLLTWNGRHLANAQISRRVARICSERGFVMPTICTPEELFGETDDE